LQVTREELESARNSHSLLSSRVDTPGASLKKRDQEALKKAQAELKDYDIYRQVMEAALARLQSEIESIHAENKALRDENGKLSSAGTKAAYRLDEEKREAIKGYAATKQRLKETEAKLEAAEAKARRLLKERDAAAASLLDAHQHHAAAKKAQDDQAALKRVAAEAKKKAAAALAQEKRTLAQLDHARAVQREALERLAELRAENEALRAASSSSVPLVRRSPLSLSVPMSEAHPNPPSPPLLSLLSLLSYSNSDSSTRTNTRTSTRSLPPPPSAPPFRVTLWREMVQTRPPPPLPPLAREAREARVRPKETVASALLLRCRRLYNP
jgi:hypothetical protein